MTSPTHGPPPPGVEGIEAQRVKIEFERLDIERGKLALEEKKLRTERPATGFRQTMSNPLVLAIIGGSVTMLTSIVTTYNTAKASREADSRRFQADLIKSFVDVGNHETSRNNLGFLADVGLIPDHADKVRNYKDSNPEALPVLAESIPGRRPGCPPLNVGPMPRDSSRPRRVSIHLGTNRLDPVSYGSTSLYLRGAVADATSMVQLAQDLGYHLNLYTDSLSCAEYLLTWLDSLAGSLEAGDTLLLTRSGGGTQVPDITGSEPDGLEEAWVMFDRPLRAGELYDKFAKFKEGVTLIVVQDSCFAAPFRPPKNTPPLAADLIILCATGENQPAMEDSEGERIHGVFSRLLLKAMKDDQAKKTYQVLIDRIRAESPAQQTPTLHIRSKDGGAHSRAPFSIGS